MTDDATDGTEDASADRTDGASDGTDDATDGTDDAGEVATAVDSAGTASDTDGTAGDADGTGDEATEGVFLVTHADEDSAVLKDVDRGQVHTLAENPGVEEHDAVEGVVVPEPPLNVTARLAEVHERRSLSIRESPEPPTTQERDIAADQAVGDLTREPRAGVGELHVISVPEDETAQAVADVLDDEEATLARAARLGVARVEVRSEPGVVSVRYLP